MYKILVVDDDKSNLESLRLILSREGFDVVTSERPEQAADILRNEKINIMITDLAMPGMNGTELLKLCKQISPFTDVVIITAYGTVEKAVEAIKEGAYDFITKPFKRFIILQAIKRILERQALVIENKALKQKLSGQQKRYEIIGNSNEIRNLLKLVDQIASSTARVLIQGESGTGKELVARAVHNQSQRFDKPFIAINCAAIPENLIESELFGYEKGAFTGANVRREGKFKLADHGTLFFDEIGELPLHLQSKLLRVIQEMEYSRLGGRETIKVDVRIIASTNKILEEEVKDGTFREDLYYRLSVITLNIPSLRQRRDDIPVLAGFFLNKFSKSNNKQIRGISREAMDKLINYSWPGNVRELENIMERAVILCEQDHITVSDLPSKLTEVEEDFNFIKISMGTPLNIVEKTVIEKTLKWTNFDKNLTARILNISPRTIYRRIEEYNSMTENNFNDDKNE